MTKSDSPLARLRSVPTDLQWSELVTTLEGFGFKWCQGSGGSHGHFYHADSKRKMASYKPHNPSVVKRYQIQQILKILEEDGFI